MKILITGATGYIGGAAAKALLARGHEVLGLARSEQAAAKLRQRGVRPVTGDFNNHASLANAIFTSDVEAVISTASVGSLGGDASTFGQDRDAVLAMQGALGNAGKTLIFTSGSAVFGAFNGGNATDKVYAEDANLPLPVSVFAPASANVPPMLAAGFGASMLARVETEKLVVAASGVRGVVVRPGLVYGHGGSYDLPAIIKLARANGCGVHLGSGATRQSYVHVDDLADLYCLAVERAPKGATLHGVANEVNQRDLAAATSRMIGAGDRTASFTMEQMLGLNAAERAGLFLTKFLSPKNIRRLQGAFTAPPSMATGISLCLNKRLSSEITRQLLGWSPRREDILEDLEFGSYAGAFQ